ncbi:methyl-accepting chemotaxis protein [Aestuariirhabdus litorea]|uniref:Methyl-accepting chemotaxis protein n=1 Tax=Aestuariirhabdus litorea TaxID=2528527 RepID=A0A3P3VMU8_9GAMM|nr:methyl-accepting chemotaxis protein [Aestuariirhabdus litorea]RRJ84092.1 methyl-accepting chemotaxis protein [Aestuariirhabdus litorea]RWW97312.1 HAMP domain-containing protein [Endozoicomonadaceae bacterium GTF-13]
MLSRFTIKQMLMATIGFAVVAFAALYATSHSQLTNTSKGVAHEQRQAQAIFALKDARYYVVQVQQFLTDVGATRNDEAKAEARESLQGALASLDRMVQILPNQAASAQQLKAQVVELHRQGERMADAYVAEGTEAGNTLMKGRGGFDDTAAVLADSLDQMADQLGTGMERASAHTQHALGQAESVVLWSSALICFALTAVFLLVCRRTLGPLARLEASMRNIASGSRDLTLRLDESGADEVAAVSRSFNLFVDNLAQLIAEITRDTEQLSSASDQLSAASRQTLDGMQRLQLETDQIATAINEMQATVHDVARNAEQAAVAVSESDEQAREGEQVVRSTISAISSLSSEVTAAASVIQALEGDAENIGTVLDVIRGVAEQTNLLALNAAIEAARAGEQGRGFAVVADEVRTLAHRTRESTDEIQQMIERLQQGAKNAVSVMQRSSELAEGSTLQAAKAGEAIAMITESVASISGMAAQIATAAEQQSAVAEDINRNIINISEEAHNTVANARESDAGSSEVGELGVELNKMVAQFKTH